MKRALSLILLLAMLATMMVALPSAASAEPSRAGCTGPKSPDGKHAWIGRERPAWCTYGGGIVYICQYCQKEVYEESTPALGHNWGEWYTQSNPDCTTPGQKVRYCRRCQQQEIQAIPALGHKWDGGTVTKQATCTEEGQKLFHCTNKFDTHNCTATRTEVIPKTNHDWSNWRLENHPSCIEKELFGRYCKICGKPDGKYGEYGDHDWGEWEVVKEPTATEEGLRERVCKLDASHKEQEAIPATGTPTEEAKYVLKGVTGHIYGFEYRDSLGIYYPTTPSIEWIWQDAAPKKMDGYSAFWTNPGETVYLTTEPVPGETYYFRFWLDSQIAKDDHSIDFTQIDPNLVNVTLNGFTVTYLSAEPYVSSSHYDGVYLHFSATYLGDGTTDEINPALHLEITWDENAGEGKRYEGAEIPLYYKVTNTGDCTVYTNGYSSTLIKDIVYPNGEAYVPELGETTAAVQPGESWTYTYTRVVKSSEVEDGYVLLDDYDNANYLDSDGKPKGVDSDIASVNIPLTYPEDSGKIEVQKVDADTGDALEGALLQLLDGTGEVLDQWTSSAEHSHVIEGLLSGKQYTLREARTPEGYDTAADIQFVLNEDGKITTTGTVSAGGVLVVEDKKLDDGPHPALLIEDTWAPDAGEGKRVKGAIVPIYTKVTNTGDCPVYHYQGNYNDSVQDLVYPNGLTYVEGVGTVYVINPGESWTYTFLRKVFSANVESGTLDFNDDDNAFYINASGELLWVFSNKFPVNIPLTYPDGTTPEEDKPGIKLTVVQITPEKEAYVDVKDWTPENFIRVSVTYTNIGNVPLRFELYTYQGAKERAYPTWYEREKILNPGESWSIPQKPYIGYYICDVHGYLPPDSEEYAGIFPFRFKVFGYAVDDTKYTTPICESNSVTFKHNIAKPGPTPWPIPEESQMEVKIETWAGPSDPAGYQLGEYWSAHVLPKNIGLVDIPAYTTHIDFIADDEYTHDKSSDVSWTEYAVTESTPPGKGTLVLSCGGITEKDVERGYVEVTAYTKWTDPDSGKERTAVANVWNVPVISKTGLVLTKKADTPPNGEYYKPGEKVTWTLDVMNNSKEPIRNVTVTDNGTVIATFAEIAAGETKVCAVPPTIVTDYDAQVTGYVMNTAQATGTDLKDATHTWYSNPAKAVCKDPDTPPVLGAKPVLLALKTDEWPKNMAYYQENEEITFHVTVINTGDCELNNLEFYDALAGFAPVDTLASLPVGASHTFDYKYTVKAADMDHPTLTNTATIKYTFLGNPGTPVTCKDTVKIGENDTITETGDPPFDPGLLKGDGDSCSLTLETLGAADARYTLHACGRHAELARAAEDAVLNGDSASPIWRAELNNLYEILYSAANDVAKGALLEERLQFENEAETLYNLYGEEALAEALRLKCAQLCCIMHTASENLPSTLTGERAAAITKAAAAETTAREIGPLQGADSEVTDTFAGPAAGALEATMDLLHSAKTYDFGDVFLRAQTLWQGALDQNVNAAYTAADRDGRKLIALWRMSLDSLLAAERPFLELLYPDNRAMLEEILMDIYKDAGFAK